MPATEVTVIRDGEEYQVDPSAVVYGDVVRLKIGQPCPGCARVVACSANARVTDGARGMSATLTVAALFDDNGSASSEGGADENADDDNVDGVPVPSQGVAPDPPLRPEVNVIPASAVLVDGEATVKRIYREGKRVRLQPSNSSMDPIYVHADEARETLIIGKVVGVFRKLS